MRLTLELEVHDERDADDFRKVVRDWAEPRGAVGKMFVRDEPPGAVGEVQVGDGRELCPACGKAMVFDGVLDAWVCGHEEDSFTA